MKINSEENTEFSGNKGQKHYSSDFSICRGVLRCTSNSAYSANKMLSECTMALDSSEDYSFLACRSLQGQVADLLREDYRTSNGWVLVSYHERGREAVTEHELQSRQLMMAAFTRYLLHAWHAADSRDQLRGVMASNSSSAAARKSQVAVAIALQSVNNKEASNANCE